MSSGSVTVYTTNQEPPTMSSLHIHVYEKPGYHGMRRLEIDE
jgi:hypothetical protein